MRSIIVFLFQMPCPTCSTMKKKTSEAKWHFNTPFSIRKIPNLKVITNIFFLLRGILFVSFAALVVYLLDHILKKSSMLRYWERVSAIDLTNTPKEG